MAQEVTQDTNLGPDKENAKSRSPKARVAQTVLLVLADVAPEETLTPVQSGAAEEHKQEA